MADEPSGLGREAMTNVLRHLNQRPIAYYPAYADLMGSVPGGVYLSQIMYWWSVAGDDFYKTDAELMRETRLSAYEIRSSKYQLKKLECVFIKAKGNPPVTHYAVNIEKIIETIASLPNLVETTKSILRPSTIQFGGNHKIHIKESARVSDLRTETTYREEDNLPLGREDSAVVETDATTTAPFALLEESAPPPAGKKTSTKKAAPIPWLLDEPDIIAFHDWITTQTILKDITPPVDYEWWCNMSEVIHGLPTLEWLGSEYAGMQMWLRENPSRKPMPGNGASRFVRNWLKKAYNHDRRERVPHPQAKEVHIHYDSGRRR